MCALKQAQEEEEEEEVVAGGGGRRRRDEERIRRRRSRRERTSPIIFNQSLFDEQDIFYGHRQEHDLHSSCNNSVHNLT